MSDVNQLQALLGLDGVSVGDMPFLEYLSKLHEHPDHADTAASTLIRAIKEKGTVKFKDAPPERQPYLRMLNKMNIEAYSAFDHIKGSQRTVAHIMEHLQNAASNGHQLYLAVIFKGGPASGKGALSAALKDCLEGQIVHTVKGCPVHENPINLLTLLPEERIDQIAEQLGMTPEASKAKGQPSLRDLIATAGRPCQHCWEKAVKDAKGEFHEEPNLANIQVERLRLSSRNFGIATWSGRESLLSVLQRGSRGIVNMPELFSMGSNNIGTNPELDLLLEATNDRRIPGMGSDEVDIPGMPVSIRLKGSAGTGWLPLDAILIGETNEGAWKKFTDAQPDIDKFTRRMAFIGVPYNTSVSEEEGAYREFIDAMRKQPHFDPMALKLAALVAVVSRLKDNTAVDAVKRARMYDGEQLRIEKLGKDGKPPADGSKSYWHVGDFWMEAGEDEGMQGLNMADMFRVISEITEGALAAPHKSVTALSMIRYLHGYIEELAKNMPALTGEQQKRLEKLNTMLTPSKKLGDKVGLIEEEYRRVLVRQLFEVASPDFDRRAGELFDRYRRHAAASGTGAKELVETVNQAGVPTQVKTKVDVDFLNDLEKWMDIPADKRDDFRRALETRIGMARQAQLQEAKDEGREPEELKLTWQSITEIADGIRKKLNSETAKVLEELLKSDSEVQLTEEQLKNRAGMLERFAKLGYNDYTRKAALTYFRDYQLWKQS